MATWTENKANAYVYVRLNGSWVIAQPYLRVSGAWKQAHAYVGK